MYRKTLTTLRLESKRRKCAAMRAAKARKRIRQAVDAIDVGGIRTNGVMGQHEIRLLRASDRPNLLVVVDGEPKEPKTYLGVWRLPAKQIGAKAIS